MWLNVFINFVEDEDAFAAYEADASYIVTKTKRRDGEVKSILEKHNTRYYCDSRLGPTHKGQTDYNFSETVKYSTHLSVLLARVQWAKRHPRSESHNESMADSRG